MKDVFNDIRVNQMGLEPFTAAWQMSQFNRMRIPYTYIWSPSFLPRAPDWGDHIDVVGYVFHEEPEWVPPAGLIEFLEADAKPPVYVGFGSMSFSDPEKFFNEVFGAIEKTGVRALVSRGWSDLGRDAGNDLPNVFFIDEAPHGWLFPRVAAVICHGGGGTTALALRSGRPTLVVPVAGDQSFWGNRVFTAGCGPEPLPIKEMTAALLAGRIEELLHPKYATAAAILAEKIAAEPPGAEAFVDSALRSFSVHEKEGRGRCDVFPERPAVWKSTKVKGARLSAVGAHVLVAEGRIRRDELKPLNLVKWPDFVSPGDPVSGISKGVAQVGDLFKRDAAKMPTGVLLMVFHVLRGESKQLRNENSKVLSHIQYDPNLLVSKRRSSSF
jgi:hypothetical protein